MPRIDWFTLAVLALAAARTSRLIGWDSITAPWRSRLLGYSDDGKRNRWPANHRTLAELVHCPYCLGAWSSLGWYAAWIAFPQFTFKLAALGAIAMIVGVFGAHVDKP